MVFVGLRIDFEELNNGILIVIEFYQWICVPLAQWIRRWSSEPKIQGSNPWRDFFSFFVADAGGPWRQRASSSGGLPRSGRAARKAALRADLEGAAREPLGECWGLADRVCCV